MDEKIDDLMSLYYGDIPQEATIRGAEKIRKLLEAAYFAGEMMGNQKAFKIFLDSIRSNGL